MPDVIGRDRLLALKLQKEGDNWQRLGVPDWNPPPPPKPWYERAAEAYIGSVGRALRMKGY